jgi:hypothetical protein
LKNWNADQREEAIPLFRQFQSSAPKAPSLWLGGPSQIAVLRELARGYALDFSEYHRATAALRAARTPEEKREALEVAKAARAEMRLPTAMAASIDERIAELEPEAAAFVAQQQTMAAEAQNSDAKLLPAAKQKRAQLLAQFRFEEARQAIADPDLQTEPAKEEQERLTKKSQWLANFKSQLVTDLNAKGYGGAIPRKSGGEPLTGSVIRADDQLLHFRTPSGTTLPWNEVPPETIITIAQSFIPADMPPQLAAFRRWSLGVFMAYVGKAAEARPHLQAASEAMEVFREEIPLATEWPEK